MPPAVCERDVTGSVLHNFSEGLAIGSLPIVRFVMNIHRFNKETMTLSIMLSPSCHVAAPLANLQDWAQI
jgi:hypothetical protein